MPDLSRYDTEYRPKSYFVTEPETAVISRIEGAVRRQVVRDIGAFDVDPATRAESLESEDREAAGRLHPSLMVGSIYRTYMVTRWRSHASSSLLSPGM